MTAAAPPIAEPLNALCAFLRSTVGSLLATTPSGIADIPANVPAVFRPDMPMGYDAYMPSAAIVCRPAGGYKQFGGTQFYIGDPLVDLICYGANQQEATSVCRTAIVVCKQMVVQEWENVLLYAAHVNAGPVPLPDAQTLWPACWASVQLVHGELPLHH